jgi:hypothetical protein
MGIFKIIKGTFHVKGFLPDGDSIRFQAENPAVWATFSWSSAAAKKSKLKQLRLEAIDAIETHYEGFHQPRTFGIGALEQLLKHLNITETEYSMAVSVITRANDGQLGFIATDGLDQFDRPISFIFPPDAPLVDGQMLVASELPLELSVNFKLCRDGLVYPTFYTTTEPLIATLFADATREARAAKRGLWVIDRSDDFTIWDLNTLFNDILILPKLFRRLIVYFDNYPDWSELPAYMKRNGDKLRLADGSDTTFDKIVEIKGRRIRLLQRPEDLFFVPKD